MTGLLACQPAREARLIWEGAGPATARTAADAVRTLAQSDSGVRLGMWGESQDATYQVLEVESAERPHTHERHDLTVVLLRGEGVLVVAGRRYEVRAGDVMHVGRGRPHHFQPRGSAVGLAVYTPRLQGRDYRAVNE